MKRTLTFLCLFFLSLGSTPAQADVIEDGKRVRFEYVLTVKGDVVDSSEGRGPLEYVHGQNMIVKGLEKELNGLKVGDEKTVVIPAADAYGEVDTNLFYTMSKSNLPADAGEPQVGQVMLVQTKNGQMGQGVITEVNEDSLVLNFNHPLAGQELTFKVKIVDIE